MKACHAAPLRTSTTPSPRYPEAQPVSGLRQAIEEAQQADAARKNPAGLLPCPFCGSSAVRLNRKGSGVICDYCAAEGPFSNSKERALWRWNSRVVVTSPPAETLRLSETVKRVAAVVAEQFEISLESLLGRGRFRQVTDPRMALYLLLRENTRAATRQIGDSVGRNHNAIRNGLTRASALLDIDPEYAARVARCRAVLAELAPAA